jgi:hypothetical protein
MSESVFFQALMLVCGTTAFLATLQATAVEVERISEAGDHSALVAAIHRTAT